MEYNWQGRPPEARQPRDWKRIGRWAVLALVAVAVLGIGTTCWYTVDEKQQAVVTTFGRVTGVSDAGIHFMLPLGIQQAHKVDVNVYQKIELGYRTDTAREEGYAVVEEESKMITGDYNIVNVEFFVEYKVSDPVRYLYGSYEPETILRNLVQSQVRNVVGSTPVDAVLTDGKEAIQMEVKGLIAEVLTEYDVGLMLTDVKIQDSDPPTEDVTYAFKAVETAKQGAETVINEANEQVAMFNAMYQEYADKPAITRSRMYYEAIQKVLPGAKVYIDMSEGGVQTLLPLESFAGGAQ